MIDLFNYFVNIMSIVDLKKDPSFTWHYKEYPNLQIKTETEYIAGDECTTFYFRVKCSKCNNYIDWFGHLGYFNKIKYALNCESYDPTDYRVAVYDWNGDCWTKMHDMVKCSVEDCYHYFGVRPCDRLTELAQCDSHDPSTNFVKCKKQSYNSYNVGWEVDKIKVLSGKRHVWKKADGQDINYVCPCGKCKKE